MNDQYKSVDLDKAPVIEPGYTFGTVTEKISAIVLNRPASNGWFIGFGLAFMLTMMLLFAIGYLFLRGIGIWGNTVPIGWGFEIVNFVWWIGIGHAGTLISAILLLLRQSWRNSINRFAEAMTLFAVACAGIFPAIHVGRPWLAYWLFPIPNTMGVWPQFRSPLMWDVFAVSTYATTSALFWFIGLIPDLATLRDRTDNKALKIVYGMFALGWRGSARHWHRYETAYLLLAGLATPLVLSVHTVVSFDFAVGIVPGWHTTIFPPYFVAGAIYSGFAMVLMLAIPIRKIYGLLATGLIVGYGYMIEAFMSWYSGDRYDAFTVWNRLHGPYAPMYYALLICNIFIPQVLWIRRLRTSPVALFLISGVILVGMWLERFVIIVMSLHRDFLTSSWGMYYQTRWDWMTYIGTMGMFLAAIFLFLRILPAISIFEMRTLLPEAEVKE
jgi:Ni/Fe-hydrogenase subunit HybB-like protein